MKTWVFDPHSGGKKIPPSRKQRVRARIQAHAEKHCAGKFTRIDVRFRGVFCYMDAYQEPEVSGKHPTADFGESREEYIERLRNTPIHLVRVRHFSEDKWSCAFYTYSHEKYEPTFFPSGDWFGTPEEAFDIGAVYLQ